MPSGGEFTFGRCRLEVQNQRLYRDDVPVPLQRLEFAVLRMFLERPGEVITKHQLNKEAWQGVAVQDSAQARVIMKLRKLIDHDQSHKHIETVARVGYRFITPVSHAEPQAPRADLKAILARHRIWVEGRAGIESFSLVQITRARQELEPEVEAHPDEPVLRVGLANALVLTFESSRTDETPDREALKMAVQHAQRACELRPNYAEAWATLGFILERAGNRRDALAALDRAIALEPDNWRHHIRLAYVSWGEGRLHAARRALALSPGLVLAYWLIASVYAARGALDMARREIELALAAMPGPASDATSFPAVAIHWFNGLLLLANGDTHGAAAAFAAELALESQGHLYAREIAANTWYALGALRLRTGDLSGARTAFEEALKRVPRHPMARAGLVILDKPDVNHLMASGGAATLAAGPGSIHAAFACAAVCAARGGAALLVGVSAVTQALASEPAGSAGWLLPLEPLINVRQQPDVWAEPLARLRERAG